MCCHISCYLYTFLSDTICCGLVVKYSVATILNLWCSSDTNSQMVRDFEDGLTGANERINRFSERALRPYLRLRIFGPYAGDCENYLRAIALELRDRGYSQARICSDHEGRPPEGATRKEKRDYWREKSFDFLEGADVAVFVFLKNRLNRSDTLPDLAFDDDCYSETIDSDEDPDNPNRLAVQDINSSVIVEFKEWIQKLDADPECTAVVYEDSCFNNIGPLLTSDVEDVNGLYDVRVPDEDVETAIERIESRAQEWISDQCKVLLQERYVNDQD